MRSSTILATSLSLFQLPLVSFALQVPSRFEPFFPSHIDDVLLSNDTIMPGGGREHELLKRANNCPSNYNSCSTFAAADAGACCTKNSVCTTDANANIACCPTGATCTGTIASRTVASATATVTATYVTNAYFPFPYIPTTYANAAACTSAYSACQSNFALCTEDLTGNGFGVTVSAVGGGVTVAPSGTNVGYSSATSICSSLSEEACNGLETSLCSQYGTGTVTTTTSGNSVFIVGTTNAAARPTVGCMAAAGVMAGVGLGIAGQIV